MNAVIVTAKGGNTSIENKNLIPVLGVPVMAYPLRAARLSSKTHHTFVSTEDPLIADLAVKEAATVIDRPAALSQPTSAHKDVIAHAVRAVEELHPDLENVVILLGNTVMVTPGLIDRAFRMLENDASCDSCMTVWQAQDDHPYRALTVTKEGYASSFLGAACGSNRQSYPPVYFYDQGIWAFRKNCAYEQAGPVPWVWLGPRCKLIERPWVTGRDIHSWIDISASVWYLSQIQLQDYLDWKDL
jgi:CMP-N-acetylneuraminic acid synthetase